MLILRACVSAVRQPESMRRAGQSMTVKEGWILLLLLASLLEVGQSELLKSQHSEEFSTDRPRGSRDSDSSPFPELRVASKGWAWAGDGCSTVSTQHTWTERSTSRSASVRCCSVSGIDITCDSRDPSGTCLPAVATYAEAEQACAAAGMRLCTRGEIEDDICCGTGCGYDGHVVWTSSGSQGLSLSLSLCVSSCCVWHTHSCAYAFVCVGSNVFSSLYVCVYVCPLIKCAAHLRVANGERVATHHASSGSWH